ncbi:MAG: tripartite tricarboxylate transporter substrate binding protein [Betaproteobacteria bacterium]|nr:MAG: tripartite tricarboxylate transporter substrate binding protein [Betaproteobacteria bacterium]TMH76905.1 MAG: tripartite tricarboxylate transporter substrate binding protein [Betaproteobacteria bacterium]
MQRATRFPCRVALPPLPLATRLHLRLRLRLRGEGGMNAGHLTAVFVVATTFAGTLAQAQTGWPSKPIRWIVPFPPGGPADVVTRMLSAKLAERVDQPAIVENRGGAGGNVGHEAAARAAPDGYTVVFVVPAIITNPFFLKASIDPFRELAPVIHLDSASMVLLTHPAFPANTVAEVISRARAKPGSVSCASSGALPQVGCEMLRIHAGAEMIMVQYKGNAPALNALMGGEVNLLFDVVNIAQGQVKSGRVRAIASTNPKRGIGPFGELPVLAETIPDFELVTWHGVMVPAATPRDIVLRLNREIQAVLENPDIRRRFADGGLDITGGTPEEFGAILKRDFTKYGKTLTGAGIKPE